MPVFAIDPQSEEPAIDQVTPVLAGPVTVAVKATWPPVTTEALGGEIETLTGATTFTVAMSRFELSAALVATTEQVREVEGAV
jgi:hypothetical protein